MTKEEYIHNEQQQKAAVMTLLFGGCRQTST